MSLAPLITRARASFACSLVPARSAGMATLPVAFPRRKQELERIVKQLGGEVRVQFTADSGITHILAGAPLPRSRACFSLAAAIAIHAGQGLPAFGASPAAGDESGSKVKAHVSKDRDVVSISWLLECRRVGRRVPLRPRHFIHRSTTSLAVSVLASWLV